MSNDPKNRTMDERQWAAYIANRKSGAAQTPSEQLVADPQQVYDLGVDSSLRGLAQIANNKDFVDEVMEKVAKSNSDFAAKGKERESLPTIAPVFVGNSEQEVCDVPDKCLASTVEKNANQAFESEANHRPVSRRHRVLVIASCLAAAAISAYFLIASLPTEQLQTVASQDPSASGKFMVRVGNPDDDTTLEDLVSDRLKETSKQPSDFSSSEPVDSLSDQIAEVENTSEGNWANDDELSGSRAGIKSEEPLKRQTPPLLASNDQSTDDGALPETQDLPELRDQPERDERIIQSDKKWELVLSCTEEGVGALTINDVLVSDDGVLFQSRDLIRGIGNEASKRLAFLQPQIGKQLGGSVTIGDKRFDFEAPTEVKQTIEEALLQLDVEPLKRRLLMAQAATQKKKSDALAARLPAIQAYTQALSDYRQATIEAAKAGSPIPVFPPNLMLPTSLKTSNSSPVFTPRQQARHSIIKESLFADLRYSPSTDELVVCEKALIETETLLRGLAKEKLLWKKQVNRGKIDKQEVALHAQSQEALANESQINDADFKSFVYSGSELVPPIKEEEFNTKSLIQHLSGLELKVHLNKNARSYDLFADAKAFRSAIDFVRTNISDRSSLPQQPTELFEPLEDILSDRPDLKGLPLVMGEDCRLSKQDAKIQSSVSSRIGRALAMFDSFGNRNIRNDTSSRRLMVGSTIKSCITRRGQENSSQALVTLDQMMQIDHTRLVLDVIENLRDANTDTAIGLLAKRAKFDLRPEVRFSATLALKEFPKDKYRNVLLEGFEYPWHVVAQHSAEALVRLDDKQAVPELVELLKQHKSLTSFEEDGKLFQKEVVAVNHLRNCLLCHAPSASPFDPSRGQVPDWERPLSREYYQSSSGEFVRADVTYLTQDFSVVQPVANPGPWPASQRFDYLVYKRPVSKKEALKKKKVDQNKVYKEAIVFALQSLTGETPEDDSWENWSRIADDMK